MRFIHQDSWQNEEIVTSPKKIIAEFFSCDTPSPKAIVEKLQPFAQECNEDNLVSLYLFMWEENSELWPVSQTTRVGLTNRVRPIPDNCCYAIIASVKLYAEMPCR